MMSFMRAHGYDPGPTERPFLAGAASGALAVIPAAIPFVGFGSFDVVSERVIRVPHAVTAVLLLAAFTVGGTLYGAVFRRAANDRQAGWLLGMAYGFLMWIAAPVAAFPLTGASTMAAGLAATGFIVTFLAWGLAAGLAYPHLNRLLASQLDQADRGQQRRFGPDAAGLKRSLLRRPR
jgi:hypothetical protein